MKYTILNFSMYFSILVCILRQVLRKGVVLFKDIFSYTYENISLNRSESMAIIERSGMGYLMTVCTGLQDSLNFPTQSVLGQNRGSMHPSHL